MPKSTLHALSQPESECDPLHGLIRTGARKLIGVLGIIRPKKT